MSRTAYGPKGARHATTLLAGTVPILYGIAVKRGADANHCVPGTANSVNLGIALENQDTAERPLAIAHAPGELVEGRVGAAVAIDALLTSDAAGKLVTATTGQIVTAIARDAATAVDQLIPVELVGPRVLAP